MGLLYSNYVFTFSHNEEHMFEYLIFESFNYHVILYNNFAKIQKCADSCDF